MMTSRNPAVLKTTRKKLTSSRACNEAFLRLLKPELLSWGLQPNPQPGSFFGGNDHGYRYDFADMSDVSDVKLAAFAIINPGQNLWIRGYRAGALPSDPADLPVLFDNIEGLFTLCRKFSIWRPLRFSFYFEQKKHQSVEQAAETLMKEVSGELPKLRKYLYG
ncbi:hypothetical protein HFC70_08365 [Agrobacterium sp. a22-2]|uniref:hypothetical protein n=1 Tax=Agrobacterium sp. a22-2 TaxID=2283840 RepID=UPI00144853A3|nr:hypothetical protein [Agrobacterium sp. a22-2]NKN36370.1 hypothetical protein [Agrobacterium sp. a22-2]